MAKNTSTWLIMFVAIFIILLGVVGTGVVINYFGKKVNNQETTVSDQTNKPNGTIKDTFTTDDGSWTVNYPSVWEKRENDNDSISFKENTPFDNQVDRGDVYLWTNTSISMATAVDDFYATHDNVSEESVLVDGQYGTRLSGEINEETVGMLPPGTNEEQTFFALPNDSVLIVELLNFDKKAMYQDVLYGLQLTDKTKTDAQMTTSSAAGNIVVDLPISGAKITSPAIVTGKARVFENVVSFELIDDSGQVLADGFTTARAADIGQFGDFEINLSFVTSDNSGTLTVYTTSAKDGSREDVVNIDVDFE
ncbi:MAG: Gmad2 immunoglobulin-like domain-containing protein [Patescibacteria group bacterium]